jgi:NAD(P)-dependent dehydrogenase (short-subunit alcohol dehydrogenase family)
VCTPHNLLMAARKGAFHAAPDPETASSKTPREEEDAMTRPDRVALVTGGSSGLGAEICRALSAKGWRVWAGSRSARSPADGLPAVPMDVTDPHAVRRAVATVLEQDGRIDMVVCNAGVQVSAPAEELPDDRAAVILDTNLRGAIHTIRAALPALRERGGSILAVGSLAGRVAPPGEAVYAASKHGLRGYLESLRHEVRPQGVRVAIVEPGYIRTALAQSDAPDWPTIPAYDAIRLRLRRHLRSAIDAGMHPETVAAKIATHAEASDPPFCTPVGASAIWVPHLKRVLPAPFFFRIVASRFGIAEKRS